MSLEDKFRAAVGNATDQRGKPALLGKGDGTLYWVDDSGMTHRTRVWARIGEQASNQLVVVDCLRASPQIDMPVRVDYKNGRLTVVDVDERRAIEFSGGRGGATVPPHWWLHSRLGPDPGYIEGLQFLPLLVTPTNPPDLTVTVQGGAYTDSAGDLAIHETAVSGSASAFVPATDYHFVIICLDRTDGSIVIVDGDDITAEDVLFSDVVVTPADIEAITISADYKTLGVMLLYPGQTQIKAKDIVMDLRADGGSGGGGTPGGSDTQIQYNNGGAFGGISDAIYNDSNGRLLLGATSPATTAKLEIHPTAAQDARNALVSTQAVNTANTVGIEYYLNNSTPAIVKYGEISVGSLATTAGSQSAKMDFHIHKGGTLTRVLQFDGVAGQTYFTNQDVVVYGSGNSNLFVANSSANTVSVGTSGGAGSIANFGPSAIVLNNGEADIDVRIAGNGVANGYFYDAGNNRHGFGTGSPAGDFHVVLATSSGLFQRDGSGVVLANNFYNADTTDGNGTSFRFSTDTTGAGGSANNSLADIRSRFYTHNHATRSGSLELRTAQNGSFTTRLEINAGVQVGAPTGGDPGAGWINVAGGVKLNNTNYTNPDYAVHHYFHGNLGPFADNPGADKYGGLVPLENLEKYLKKNLHLPNRWESQNVFEWADMAQMWCEELAIYVAQLHKRVKELENGR